MKEVITIDKKLTYEWLEHKHYAHRLPAVITNSFGLFLDGKLEGVCTYSPPPRMYNNGDNLFKNDLKVKTIELNRLCINEGLPKNILSYFVSGTFKLLKNSLSQLCLVSYADSNQNHHGYIYQATNWIYTGLTISRDIVYDESGTEVHTRTIGHRLGSSSREMLEQNNFVYVKQKGKHRYFQFIGSKTQLKTMRKNFKFEALPYPKGDNQRYDSSYQVKTSESIDNYFE